eukprot:SAG22_NODE_7837_length_703_cov_1.607616_1_plen_145_part_10
MVRAQMKKQVLREKFLYASPPVLDVMASWLLPVRLDARKVDGKKFPKSVEPPNKTLRRGLIEVLDEMTDPARDGTMFETNMVMDSGIGKAIMLWKTKDNDPEVKQMAQRLIDRWARPALGVGDLSHTRILEGDKGGAGVQDGAKR